MSSEENVTNVSTGPPFRRKVPRRPMFPPNNGIVDEKIPKIHEIVMMDKGSELLQWLELHPGDMELQHHRRTPLLVAIQCNSGECFDILVRKNANIEEYNSNKETALVKAIKYNRVIMTERLLARKANILAVNCHHESVTSMAIARDDVILLAKLHYYNNHLLDHDLHNGNYPLDQAIFRKARKCFDFIINLKPMAQSFLIKRDYNCPIKRAIKMSDVESLEKLAQLKDFRYVINEMFTDEEKVETTYLHMAVKLKNAKIAEILIKKGANVQIMDEEGNQPIHVARTWEMAKLLWEHKAYNDERNENDKTPLEQAKTDGRNGVYQFLRLKTEEDSELNDFHQFNRWRHPCARDYRVIRMKKQSTPSRPISQLNMEPVVTLYTTHGPSDPPPQSLNGTSGKEIKQASPTAKQEN